MNQIYNCYRRLQMFVLFLAVSIFISHMKSLDFNSLSLVCIQFVAETEESEANSCISNCRC
jgi:hypothetical protein